MLEEVRNLIGKPVIEVKESESGDESYKTEPASKCINRRTKATELWKSFEETLEESGSLVDSGPTSIDSSVEQYLAGLGPLTEFHRSKCYDWWGDYKARFPQHAKLAQQYNSILQHHQHPSHQRGCFLVQVICIMKREIQKKQRF